jgi:hypothetical protein
MNDDFRLSGMDRRWRHLNAPFSANNHFGEVSGPAWEITTRDRPLVITAVHGVVHQRPGRPDKPNDANTGGLARCLAVEVGATSAVILRSDGEVDANRDTNHPVKCALSERGLIGPGVVLLDLHGSSDSTPIDVTVGRGPIRALGDEHGFEVDPDGSVTGLHGAGRGTVTAFAQTHGASAIQIEIAHRNRSFLEGRDRRLRLLRSLVALCSALA